MPLNQRIGELTNLGEPGQIKVCRNVRRENVNASQEVLRGQIGPHPKVNGLDDPRRTASSRLFTSTASNTRVTSVSRSDGAIHSAVLGVA